MVHALSIYTPSAKKEKRFGFLMFVCIDSGETTSRSSEHRFAKRARQEAAQGMLGPHANHANQTDVLRLGMANRRDS